MVVFSEIQASNALINDETVPRIAVFVGGTSGIGKYTVKALVGTGASVRIYLVGRPSSAERTQAFIQELHAINPKAEVIWTQGEVSLLEETKRVCEIIKSKESRVDLLFLTAGYAPFGECTETAEGLEITQSLAYYSRILFTIHLLPLLAEGKAPRVISVLGGGLERASIDLDNLDLKKPGSFGVLGHKAQILYTAMNTMTLEKLSIDNPEVTFIHAWPGFVNTGNVHRGLTQQNWIMPWFIWLILDPIIRFLGYSEEECGQRYLFQCTSALYGGRGLRWNGKAGINSLGKQADGLFLVHHNCGCGSNPKNMSLLRKEAQEKVWEHTQKILQPFL